MDCEYNRHGVGLKRQTTEADIQVAEILNRHRPKELLPNQNDEYVYTVRPDIVVHQRLNDLRNLLAIEIKKKSNPAGTELDDLKLRIFTRPQQNGFDYGYCLGALVEINDKVAGPERSVAITRIYKAGDGKEWP